MRLTLSLIVQIANAIECWTCDSGSMTDCILFGGPRTCPGHEVCCQKLNHDFNHHFFIRIFALSRSESDAANWYAFDRVVNRHMRVRSRNVKTSQHND